MTNGINVILKDFDNSIPAVSTLNDDGSYTIFLNARLNSEQQSDGYIHELKHILQLDFENNHCDVNRIEAYRHGI